VHGKQGPKELNEGAFACWGKCKSLDTVGESCREHICCMLWEAGEREDMGCAWDRTWAAAAPDRAWYCYWCEYGDYTVLFVVNLCVTHRHR
jgi:hypothetical protein